MTLKTLDMLRELDITLVCIRFRISLFLFPNSSLIAMFVFVLAFSLFSNCRLQQTLNVPSWHSTFTTISDWRIRDLKTHPSALKTFPPLSHHQ